MVVGTDGSPPHRVLVIDDDPRIRSLLEDVLGVLGYDVTVAASGTEGLALVEGGGFDLVLTDLRMPGISGWEVVERVRRTDPRARLLVVSGTVADSDVERACRERIEILPKPVTVEALRQAVSRMLSGEHASDGPQA
ncbi:MAG: response regulator [Candidatus Rokubacteria bacterium]|nr:response regulator [Candidatus Rokubacteria bacterium]